MVKVSPVSLIRRGRERVRAAPWRGDGAVALITPVPEAPFLSVDFVRHCLDTLADAGFERVLTAALSPLEQTGFIAAGFAVEESLRLLGLDLDGRPAAIPPGPRLRAVPARRRREVLAVDEAAFAEFWRFDDLALGDALSATPDSRFRMAARPFGPVVGYAICGRSGARGYVQRLAVHPAHQGQGIGRRLLLDGLYWMADHGVARVVVNTQATNAAALALYEDVGFAPEPVGLSVLSARLTSGPDLYSAAFL